MRKGNINNNNATNIGGITSAFAKGARRTGDNATNIGGVTSAFARGFTLAEVLITLGIIGIVAAMTLPTLIDNYQKRKTVSKLKQAYSIFTQVVKRSEDDGNGGLFDQTYCCGQDDNFKREYFDKYLSGLVTDDKKWSLRKLVVNSANNNFGYPTSAKVSCMQNGMCYWIYQHGTNYFYIYVDLNGITKGPNRLGRDTFIFNVHFLDRSGTVLDVYPLGCNQASTIERLKNNCNRTSSSWSNGDACAAIIMRNGWKIPKDYPW